MKPSDHEEKMVTFAVQLLKVRSAVRCRICLAICIYLAFAWFTSTTSISSLQSLSELHDRAHIAHLDVNPNNIMLAQSSTTEWQTMKLIDFGLASNCKSGKNSISAAVSLANTLLSCNAHVRC